MHVHLDINGHTDYSHWHDIYPVIFEDIIMPSSAHQLLLAGVTSARDCGAPLNEIISVREKIKKTLFLVQICMFLVHFFSINRIQILNYIDGV